MKSIHLNWVNEKLPDSEQWVCFAYIEPDRDKFVAFSVVSREPIPMCEGKVAWKVIWAHKFFMIDLNTQLGQEVFAASFADAKLVAENLLVDICDGLIPLRKSRK